MQQELVFFRKQELQSFSLSVQEFIFSNTTKIRIDKAIVRIKKKTSQPFKNVKFNTTYLKIHGANVILQIVLPHPQLQTHKKVVDNYFTTKKFANNMLVNKFENRNLKDTFN